MRPRLLLIPLLLILGACNLTAQPPTAESITVPTINPGGKPVVTITAPKQGDEIVVGSQMFVTANARDAVGVTRVQLLANDQIVKTISSESASGQTNFDVLLDYTPRSEGQVILELIAYRGAIASDPANVTVNVRRNQAGFIGSAGLTGGSSCPAGAAGTDTSSLFSSGCRPRQDPSGRASNNKDGTAE